MRNICLLCGETCKRELCTRCKRADTKRKKELMEKLAQQNDTEKAA